VDVDLLEFGWVGREDDADGVESILFGDILECLLLPAVMLPEPLAW